MSIATETSVENGNHWIVRDLLALIGDAVLLPIPYGEKGPTFKGWQNTTPEQMQSAEYLAKFDNRLNIGVLLGKPSGGLCSIDIDDDARVPDFLELNPRLQNSLRTRGKRGCNVWVRITGNYPPLAKLDTFGEWRADGGQTVIHGRHPSGCDYSIVHRAQPVEIRFEEIRWPEKLALPWVRPQEDNLQDRFGHPFVFNDKGTVSGINERYWAGLHLAENHLLHEPGEREFYAYDDGSGLWRPITSEALQERLSARLFQYRKETDAPEVEKLIKQARIKPVVETLRGMAEKRDAFTNKPRVIHFANGVVRFTLDRDILFGGFSPDDFSRNQSPIAYAEGAECPRFLNELLLSAVSEDDADLIQRWAGVALFGFNLPQRILILDGTPGGGKSTLALVLSALVGRQNCYQLRTNVLTERFETYRYRGKTLLVGSDVAADFLMRPGAAVLKSLVGGDLLSCEGKNLNGDFQIKGVFNVLISCNTRLQVRLQGDSGAWRRRLLIVRYERLPVEKKIQNFDDLLIKTEGPGIARWALAGFVKALREFNETGDFRLTDAQKARVDGLLAESESILHFLTDCLSKDDDGDVTSSELTQAYAEYCSDKGWQAAPITVIERQLADLLLREFQSNKRHDLKRDGKCTVRGWSGVRLRL